MPKKKINQIDNALEFAGLIKSKKEEPVKRSKIEFLKEVKMENEVAKNEDIEEDEKNSVKVKKYKKIKIGALIMGSSIGLFGLILSALFVFNNCKSMTKLERCLSNTSDKTLFGKKAKDSAVLGKCDRYHREEAYDKYGVYLVPKKRYDPKKKKLVVDLDEDGKIQYIKGMKSGLKSTLIFIENGGTDGIPDQ